MAWWQWLGILTVDLRSAPPPIELLDFRVWRRLHPKLGEPEAREAWGSARSA